MIMICLLAVGQHSLMNQALVAALLSSNPEHEVVTSNAEDLDALVNEISELKPNVVVLGEAIPLAAMDSLAHVLISLPELRVIVVSQDTNWVHVFNKREQLLTRQSDLLDIVYSN
jgi:chemotaxis response regulator CheB